MCSQDESLYDVSEPQEMEPALLELEREFFAALERTRQRVTRLQMETLLRFLIRIENDGGEEPTVRHHLGIRTEIARQQERDPEEVWRDLRLACRIFEEEGGEAFLPDWDDPAESD